MTSRASVAVGVFALALVVYNANFRPIAALDSMPARLLPFALLTTGRLDLDRFATVLPTDPERSYWYTRSRSGRFVSIYPPVVPLLVTPLFVPAVAWTVARGSSDRAILDVAAGMDKVAASVVAALSAAIVFLVLDRFATRANALLLTFAYAFATETWVISSQSLWSHGASELFLAGLLLALARGSTAALAGSLAGLLAVTRPPSALFVGAAFVYVAMRRPKDLPWLVAGVAAVAVPSVAWNLSVFGKPLGGYSELAHTGFWAVSDPTLFGGIAGLLVSPGRGLLVFAPFFAFLAASIRRIDRPDLRDLLLPFGAAAALQVLVYGSFAYWTAGVCYGPRYLTDVTPVLILALVPAVERLGPRARGAFVISVAFGVFVQAIGAFSYPKGGTNRDFDPWDPANVQWVLELRGGLARPVFLEVLICRGLGSDRLPWGAPCESASTEGAAA